MYIYTYTVYIVYVYDILVAPLPQRSAVFLNHAISVNKKLQMHIALRIKYIIAKFKQAKGGEGKALCG
jgi:hypothetical protein